MHHMQVKAKHIIYQARDAWAKHCTEAAFDLDKTKGAPVYANKLMNTCIWPGPVFSQPMTHQAAHSAACACTQPPPEQVLG